MGPLMVLQLRFRLISVQIYCPPMESYITKCTVIGWLDLTGPIIIWSSQTET